MTQGYVYLCGYEDMVKVGLSVKPDKRMEQLNTSSPKLIELYVKIESQDMEKLERRLHILFDDDKMPGKREWFTLSANIKAFIMHLKAVEFPTDFDVGLFIGIYRSLDAITEHERTVKQLTASKRHAASLELAQQELWAIEHAVTSLGIRLYPAFQERYNEAKELLATLGPDESPIFIRKSDGELTVAPAPDDTSALKPQQPKTTAA